MALDKMCYLGRGSYIHHSIVAAVIGPLDETGSMPAVELINDDRRPSKIGSDYRCHLIEL